MSRPCKGINHHHHDRHDGWVEVEDEARWAAIADTDVCRRWWRFMRDIMPSNPDASPVSRDLREVFHLKSGER